MRKKVASTIDEQLYEEAKAHARREGRNLNELIEDALRAYLDRSEPRRSVVDETFGVFRLPMNVVRQIAEEDLYGPG